MASRRDHRAYREKRDRLKRMSRAKNADCHLCEGVKGPIRYDAGPSDPLSFEADHISAVAAGGHMLGPLAPAHKTCNGSRGKRTVEEFREALDKRTPTQVPKFKFW